MSFRHLIIFLLFCVCLNAQEYSPLTVKDTLKTNANSVIRDEQTLITIDAIDEMTIAYSRVITVFNKTGLNQVGAYVHYDDASKVKDLDLYVYDLVGQETEHFKKRDFIDQSAVSGGTLYSDNRVYHIDYKPRNYPVTLKFEYELKTSNTAFIRPFFPLERYYQSVENASFKIVNNTAIKLRSKTQNFEGFSVTEVSDFHYTAEDMPAIKNEVYSPSLESFIPSVNFALNAFNLEGVQGSANNWQEFGLWQYENFLKDKDKLPPELVEEIKTVTADAKTDKEKAKLIFQYMQDNSRYISVQLGIGGWRPMPAEDVYEKNYGDCKALTNYTQALLNVVDIESKYCVVYSGSGQRDIDPDFFSMQGDHVIVQVIDASESYWLESTSQTKPFDFLGNFTDGRKVLAIDENGGEIIETPQYINDFNLQESVAKINFEQLDLHAEIKITSHGTQYDSKAGIERLETRLVQKYYKNYWSSLNRLTVNSFDFTNNKDEVILTEEVDLSARNYLQKLGNDIILIANPFNQNSITAKTYKERTNPFQIKRGYKDIDQFEFTLGELQVSSLPEDITIASKFGKYELHFNNAESHKLTVNRNLELYKNNYDKTEYADFVAFLDKISKSDQTKLILN
ncbi:MAG: DUF3857 domain-containing transglutaminase family protein, partial [Psychroflexus sp.]|nr:DUF3857 domain-containing transglutaminase family protein [Psychroflexus sp.]